MRFPDATPSTRSNGSALDSTRSPPRRERDRGTWTMTWTRTWTRHARVTRQLSSAWIARTRSRRRIRRDGRDEGRRRRHARRRVDRWNLLVRDGVGLGVDDSHDRSARARGGGEGASARLRAGTRHRRVSIPRRGDDVRAGERRREESGGGGADDADGRGRRR